MIPKRILLVAAFSAFNVGAAGAQEAFLIYNINGQDFGLFGYYVSNDYPPIFLAVFRPGIQQSQHSDQFDYQSACEAILAAPPDFDGIPSIEPLGGVVFYQIVSYSTPNFPLILSKYEEFNVKDADCLSAEPDSLYVPVPGFTPGIDSIPGSQ